jgi:hypothetical protein
VVLVGAVAGWARLTGEVQRVGRALGDHDPCVEVLPVGVELTPYHRAALAAADLVCTGAAVPEGQLLPA